MREPGEFFIDGPIFADANANVAIVFGIVGVVTMAGALLSMLLSGVGKNLAVFLVGALCLAIGFEALKDFFERTVE